MQKLFTVFFLLSLNLNAQIESITSQVLKEKIDLDTKVKLSKNYFKVSAGVLVGGLLLKSIKKDWEILGSSGSIAAIGTTSYYLAKHLVYVSKRNRFYRQNNLSVKERRGSRKNQKQSPDK